MNSLALLGVNFISIHKSKGAFFIVKFLYDTGGFIKVKKQYGKLSRRKTK
jgi:hypothetical protein